MMAGFTDERFAPRKKRLIPTEILEQLDAALGKASAVEQFLEEWRQQRDQALDSDGMLLPWHDPSGKILLDEESFQELRNDSARIYSRAKRLHDLLTQELCVLAVTPEEELEQRGAEFARKLSALDCTESDEPGETAG